MVICENLLFSNGAKLQCYHTGEFIFREGTAAKYYFQIQSGTVKINNFLENGKEYVHGLPFDGHCIGESYLFTDNNYAINAIAVTDCYIIKIEKSTFLEILIKDPDLTFKVSKYTAERLHFRYIISATLVVRDPEIKLKKLFEHLKKYFNNEDNNTFLIPYTRQQIADLTGLRVETVIRTVKKMEKQKIVTIDKAKIYY